LAKQQAITRQAAMQTKRLSCRLGFTAGITQFPHHRHLPRSSPCPARANMLQRRYQPTFNHGRERNMDRSVISILEEVAQRKPHTLRGQDMLNSLNLDSLDIVTLIVEIDTAFGVTISPADYAACERVDDLVKLVHDAAGPRSAAA
jgi:acyl carrier protein